MPIAGAEVNHHANNEACNDDERLSEQQVLLREEPTQCACNKQADYAADNSGRPKEELEEVHVGRCAA
jgi:hypothetical protein